MIQITQASHYSTLSICMFRFIYDNICVHILMVLLWNLLKFIIWSSLFIEISFSIILDDTNLHTHQILSYDKSTRLKNNEKGLSIADFNL